MRNSSRIIFIIFINFFLIGVTFLFPPLLFAQNVEVILGTTDGSDGFSLQDSNPTEMTYMDSNGNIVTKGCVRIDAGGIKCTDAENLIIDGSVGIGTTVPGADLQIVGGDVWLGNGTFDNASANEDLYVTGNIELDGNLYLTGTTEITGTTTQDGALIIDETNIEALLVRQNADADDVFIVDTTNGIVKIEGPTPQLTIGDADAEDTVLVYDGNAQDFYIGIDDDTDDLTIGTGAAVGTNALMVVENNGNVGLGTTVPNAVLEIIENGVVPFMVSNGVGGVGNFMIVTTAGNVGISTTVPDAIVTVDQTNPEAFLVRQDADAKNILVVDTTNSQVEIYDQLGVGGTPAGGIELDVTGDIDASGEIEAGNIDIDGTEVISSGRALTNITAANIDNVQVDGNTINATNDSGLLLYDNDTNGIVIADAGNVGIGTTTINALLVVGSGGSLDNVAAGDAYIKNDLEVDGNLYVTGTVTQTGTSSYDEAVTVDIDNDEALLVRKNNDGGDVFVVDTNNSQLEVYSQIGVGGTPAGGIELDVTGDIDASGEIEANNFDVDATEVISAARALTNITAATIDSIAIDGTTVGHTGDTDLLTFAASNLTLAGTLTTGNNAIDGTNYDMTAAGALTGVSVDVSGEVQANNLDIDGTDVVSAARALTNITAATIDNIAIDGTTIGHTADTDLLTFAAGNLTLAGTLTTGNNAIDGTNYDMTAAGALTGVSVDVSGEVQANNVDIDGTDVISAARALTNITAATIDNVQVDGNTVNATTAAGLFLYEDGASGIFIRDGGNVGIGTTTVDALLVVGSGGSLDNVAAGDAYVKNDLEVDGNLYVTGSVTQTGASSYEEAVTIDLDNTEALLVRKNGDGGDILLVDTTNSQVEVYSQVGIGGTPAGGIELDVTGDIDASGEIEANNIDIDGTEVISSASALTNITAATIDSIAIDGTTIGHTTDTDLLTFASGALTIAGTTTGTGSVTLNDNDGTSGDVNLVLGDANETGNIGNVANIYDDTGTNSWLELSGCGASATLSSVDAAGTITCQAISIDEGEIEVLKDLVAGSGLTGGSNDVLTGDDGDITISHDDTSAQASVDNSNGSVIQDVSLDTYGHVSSLTSYDLDGRYFTETESNTNFVDVAGDTMTASLTLNDNDGASSDVNLVLGDANETGNIGNVANIYDDTGTNSWLELSGCGAAETVSSVSATGTITCTDISITDAEVSNTLTASDLVAAGSVVADAEVDDTITVSGGTIGSNTISGTLTTSGALTIGDDGDNVIISAANWDVSAGGAISAATVDTGFGANELYDMNQHVLQASAVTFATLDTGYGANELWDMNQHVLTSSNVAFNQVTAGTFLYSSDRRLKKNINRITDAFEKIMELEGVYFDWKRNGSPSMGFIAQDLEKVFPRLVAEGEDGMKAIQYGQLTAVLVEAIKYQEQKHQLEMISIREEIESLKNEIELLKK